MGMMQMLPPSAGELKVWGEAEVRNGPGICHVEGCGCGDLHFRARNKIVGQGLRHIYNCALNGFVFSYGSNNPVNATLPPLFETNVQSRSNMRLGTGSLATVDGTTTLGGIINTAPDATAIATDNPSTGVYRQKFIATWNSGTLTAVTVNELGIFGHLVTGFNTTSSGGQGTHGSANLLFARLTATDGEFVSFTVNPAAPLVIEYRVVFTFT